MAAAPIYRIQIHPDAEADLAKIGTTNKRAADLLMVLIEEFLAKPPMIHDLAVDGAENQAFVVGKFNSVGRLGYDMFVAKFKKRFGGTKFNHRLFYVFDDTKLCIHVLGATSRDNFDYEPDHPLTKRICATYDALGLPKSREGR